MLYQKISGFSDEIDANIAVQFGVLNKLGMGWFEPRGVEKKNISELSDEEVRILKCQMENRSIQASSIGSPVGKISITGEFEPHMALLKRTIHTAKMLNCGYIRMFSFFADGSWTVQRRDEVLRRMDAMVKLAKEENVTLLHENEKDIYGDTPERCLDLMDNFRCEYFGAVFDPANFVQCGVDTLHALDLLQKDVRYVHIKDAMYADGKVTPAGLGEGNVEAILKRLFADGYDGFLSLEPHLGRFEGLAALEKSDSRGIMKDLPKGGEGTFTLAYRALLDILGRVL